MPLSSDPSVTYSAQGNVTPAGTALAAGATSAGVTVDFSSNKLGGSIAVTATFGTVAATAGCQVQVFAAQDSTPHFDTIALTQFAIPAVASSTQGGSVFLPTGMYQVKVTDLDATNGITYGITSNPVA